MPRVVHLALADARGHLMRAHLLRELLGSAGIDVDIVTTQAAGAAFLSSLGTPCAVLPGGFRMELDARHRLLMGRTRRRVLHYALAEMQKDVAALRVLVDGADLVINDSFHPVLLAAHHTLPGVRVVHLHGDNLKKMVTATSRPFHIERWLARGFAEIVHTLAPVAHLEGGRVVRLPPLVAAPRRAPAALRHAIAPHGARIAAVYLNPHYSDPAIAALVERSCAAAGFVWHGVAEAFADRPGWCAADPFFLDVVAAADVFVSGAGMGALEQARVTGTPLLCLLGRQQEQNRNVLERGLAHVHLGAAAHEAETQNQIVQALAALPKKRDVDATTEIARVHGMWTTTFVRLLEETKHEAANGRARDRDQQPARRHRHRRRVARTLARASARADSTPVFVG